MNYSKLVISAIAFTCIASTPAMAAKNYYKWTDAQGVTHYSAQRPNGIESEAVSISGGRTTVNDDTNAASTKKSNNTPVSETTKNNTAAEGVTKDDGRCKVAKETLETLKNYARIRMKDENGDYKYLDDKEKAERKSEAQKAMEESC